MATSLTASPDFVIRPLNTASEIEAFFMLNAQVFRPQQDIAMIATRRLGFITESPDFHPEQLRGAFLGSTFVGGYGIPTFTLHMGSARLPISGIGAVMTHPAYRHQGIGATLMRNAIQYATQRHHALLLLHGIPDYYAQFGYVKMMDEVNHAIALEEIHALPPSPYKVRSATQDDVPALRILHQRHYGSYPGSFDRTLELQAHLLRHALVFAEEPPVVVLSPDDKPRGYLFPFQGHIANYFVMEVATEDWPATLALLHYHAQLVASQPDLPKEVAWPLPPDSPTLYLLADHVTVRSETERVLNAGWMACPAHLPTLLQAMLPLWQERIARQTPTWSGIFALEVDHARCYLDIRSGTLQMKASPATTVEIVRLTARVFLQLLFGYRPLSWASHQPDQVIPSSLLPVLAILFPHEPIWLAGTNSF